VPARLNGATFLVIMFLLPVAFGALSILVVHAVSMGSFKTVEALIALGALGVIRGVLKDRTWTLGAEETLGGGVAVRYRGIFGRWRTGQHYAREELAASLPLRQALRARFSLAIDLGDDSPEYCGPGAQHRPAEWTPVASLPDANAATAWTYRGMATRLAAYAAEDLRLTRRMRQSAGLATTVVDEAVLDDERLYVREGEDIASIDLAHLREERARSDDGSVTFVFGKATRVVFVDEDNDVVRALRERLAAMSHAAEDEVSAARTAGGVRKSEA
jgi:hypothetical protein